MEAGGERPSVHVLALFGRCEPLGELAQLGGGRARAATAGVAGGPLEAVGDHRVGAGCGEREVAPALLLVHDERSQALMQLAPRELVETLVGARREERVREADAFAVELDHLGRQRGSQRVLARTAAREQVKRGAAERGGHGQRLSRCRRQGLEAGEHQVAQTLRHRRRLARGDLG